MICVCVLVIHFPHASGTPSMCTSVFCLSPHLGAKFKVFTLRARRFEYNGIFFYFLSCLRIILVKFVKGAIFSRIRSDVDSDVCVCASVCGMMRLEFRMEWGVS